ncbi:hypothetical protein [Legionella worsleiensis]|uniref:Uncharacterized protein n=1 Tax=Legionella worsleiensis TaxID=45076 RepID=A0A0W1AIK2_9GAMM|nr:hypothetical protein [Legionella worsleiensis]KTD81164.1 hypothetical protein Lwor_0842 [Legionella worsleiensis]STY33139.1 Uncharacterised protein [Legionella worsleiensis]
MFFLDLKLVSYLLLNFELKSKRYALKAASKEVFYGLMNFRFIKTLGAFDFVMCKELGALSKKKGSVNYYAAN